MQQDQDSPVSQPADRPEEVPPAKVGEADASGPDAATSSVVSDESDISDSPDGAPSAVASDGTGSAARQNVGGPD
jgi:hypothetical protein